MKKEEIKNIIEKAIDKAISNFNNGDGFCGCVCHCEFDDDCDDDFESFDPGPDGEDHGDAERFDPGADEAPEFASKKEMNLVAPFENYVKKMRALLGADPDVTVVADSKKQVINICVAGCDKPNAYRVFFPNEQEVEGIGKMKILINGHEKKHKTKSNITVLKEMFANHPLVHNIEVSKFDDDSVNRIFVIFKNTTVQFKNDNWGSPWNVTTMVAEDLAREVMDGSGMTVLWTTYSDMSLAEHSPENPFGKMNK